MGLELICTLFFNHLFLYHLLLQLPLLLLLPRLLSLVPLELHKLSDCLFTLLLGATEPVLKSLVSVLLVMFHRLLLASILIEVILSVLVILHLLHLLLLIKLLLLLETHLLVRVSPLREIELLCQPLWRDP